MAFAESQVKALAGKLRARHVKTRIAGGKTLSYIEGWRAIDEANRIFGFDGWDRETLESKCIWQSASRGAATCAYTAKVRIRADLRGPAVAQFDHFAELPGGVDMKQRKRRLGRVKGLEREMQHHRGILADRV